MPTTCGTIWEAVVFDERQQAEIEERIDLIAGLKRKYGNSEEDILNFCAEAQKKLERLQNAKLDAARLTNEIETLKDQLYGEYQNLSGLRRKAAENFPPPF